MSKQSSIDWLIEQIVNHNGVNSKTFEQAKAMHKEEIEKLLKIIDWYDNHGDVRPDNETYSWFIQLWNKTFGGQDESNH